MGQQFQLFYGQWEGEKKTLGTTGSLLFGKFPEQCYGGYAVNTVRYILRNGPQHVAFLGGESVEPILVSSREIKRVLDYRYLTEVYDDMEDPESLRSLRQKAGDESNRYADPDITIPRGYDLPYQNNEYIVSHTSREYLSAARYIEKSSVLGLGAKKPIYIDPVLALTESGGGVHITLINGASAGSDIDDCGRWFADSLEIVKQIPEGYAELDVGFAEAKGRAVYCISRYGFDPYGQIYDSKDGDYLEICGMGLYGCGPSAVATVSFGEKSFSIGVSDKKEPVSYCLGMAGFINDLLKRGAITEELARRLTGVSAQQIEKDAGSFTYIRESLYG